MRIKTIWLLALAIGLAVGPVTSSGAGTVGALSGSGVSSFNECEPDSLQLAINGVEAGENSWTFDVAAVNTDPTCVIPAITITATGTWTPAGGCVPLVVVDAVIGDSFLCLVNPAPSGPLTTYDFAVCQQPVSCSGANPDQVTVLVVEA